MSELGSMRPEDRKTIEEYLRRYEDQTLKALESHSNAFGQALLAAYLLFPADILLHNACHPERYRIPLMIALYLYMTYNMKVLGSLVKDVIETVEKIRVLHSGIPLKLIHWNSSRIKLASPLGPLQWVSIRIARKIAASAAVWSFWIWVLVGLVLLALILLFLLFPLVGVLSGCPLWSMIAVLLPAYYGARLCFRFPRPLVYLIRKSIQANARRFRVRGRFMEFYGWLSDRFDDDPSEDGPAQ